MKHKSKTKILLVIDPALISRDTTSLLVRLLQEEKIKFSTSINDIDETSPVMFFIEQKNLRKVSKFKNKLIVLPEDNQQSSLSVSKLNFNSYEDIIHFLETFFLSEKRVLIQERIRESSEVFENIRMTLDQKNIDQSLGDLHRIYEHLLDLEIALLKEETTTNWNDHFKVFVKKATGEVTNVALLESAQLMEDDIVIDENTLIFKLPHLTAFFIMRFKYFDINKDAAIVDLLLSMLHRTLSILDQKLVKSDGEVDFWKKIFSKIPYPMAVISSLGDLLIYNETFAKMGLLPKECQRFKDQESVELFQQFYKVRRIDFPINLIDVSYFVFYTAEKEQIQMAGEKVNKKTASVDDLGIISSSIAHELNNPLAGILAALSLLSLEDNWSTEALSDLEDMRNGAKRCKELVDIFLGFSKFSPKSQALPSIKDSLDQAINLLRFRMIESNLRLEMRYSPTLEHFSHQVNSSIMSMILYLICSELMTAFAHHRLINQNQQGQLSGDVLEFTNQIILRMDHDFEYEEKIAQSKLIQHLLIFEKLEINFMKQEMRLIYRS
jgi:hypothetical protein